MKNAPNNNFSTLLIMLLAALGFLLVTLLAFGVALWLAWVVLWLGIKKQWVLLVSFVAIGILLQTIKYRNKDIFADSCANIRWEKVQGHLDDEEWMEAMIAANGHPFNDDVESGPYFHHNFTLLWAPHKCSCNPCIFYSEDGRYKAAVYHTHWKNYWLFQTNKFTITYDRNIEAK